MGRIVGWCLNNKSIVVLATVLLIAGGLYGTTRLNQELLPEVEFPIVTVSTPVTGAGPDIVDEQVSQPLESAIEGVDGIESIESTSSQGFSLVIVEFDLQTDPEAAREDISRAIEGVELPEQAGEPRAERQSFDSFPALSLSLSARDGDLRSLTDYAEDEVKPLLEEVEGVGNVEVSGGEQRRIRVALDPQRLSESGLTAQAVVGEVGGAGSSAPAGTVVVEGTSEPINVRSGIQSVEELRGIPLVPGGASAQAAASGNASVDIPDGAIQQRSEPVKLGDVAEVEEVNSRISGLSRTGGEPSLTVNVFKEPDGNTVEVSEGVREKLGQVREELGRDRVNVVFDTAQDVEESVGGLIEKALLGALFAVVVIFAFLRSLRATLVTAVSLPTSVLAALLFSWGQGLTLNILTLAGLTIAVGRVVDDAIVVLENSYRHVQEGVEPEQAALRGTTEVSSAITSSTLTTVAVFLPLGLVGGIVSEFFLPLSLTVAFALLASLLVAITIIPVLVSLFLKRRQSTGQAREGWLSRIYTPVLRSSLNHRVIALGAAAVLFAGGLGAAALAPTSFFPRGETTLISANVTLPEGTTLEESSQRLNPFEEFLMDEDQVENYQLAIGGEDTLDPGGASRQPENEAQLFITTSDSADTSGVLEDIRNRGRELYGEEAFEATAQDQSGPPSGGLEVTVTGDSQEELQQAASKVTDEVTQVSQVTDVSNDAVSGGSQLSVSLDSQKAAAAGLNVSRIARELATLTGEGQELEFDGAPVEVRASEEATSSLEDIKALPVGPQSALGDVATVTENPAPATINRVDGELAATITGEITAQNSGPVLDVVQSRINSLDLPEGVSTELGGEQEDIQQSFQDLFVSIAVALALVYLILVVFFGSLTLPFVILLAVPLTTVGAFGALLLTDTALSVPALLGVLLLIGIVVSNSILLVDFAIKSEKRSGSAKEAMMEAGQARLRPILMTALVTIFALLPLAFGLGGGSVLISSSLAIPVIGGLLTSTFFTLLVVPAGFLALRGVRRHKVEKS
jgi:multidrug efflux pump subunit AcrB